MFLTDKPISRKEDDLIQRSGYAENLASALLQSHSSETLVVGLQGSWGTGKTSLLHMMKETITMETQGGPDVPILFDFNPWNYTGQQQLISMFFEELSLVLKRKDKLGKLAGISEKLHSYSQILNPAKYIPGIGSFVEAFTEAVGITNEALQQKKEERESDLPGIKEELSRLLLQSNRKIFVFIDDIDRLTSEEIRQIFQLVKSVGDLPNINYILSFDREVVVQALNKSQENFGETYLEKIIQVPIDVPTPSTTEIQQVLIGELDKPLLELPQTEFDTNRWSEVYFNGIQHLICSLRDVNRFCNTFRFNYLLTKDEVNTVDLLGLTAIQVFLPDLYRSIQTNPKLFLPFHSNNYYKAEEKESNKRKYQQIVDKTCSAYSFDIDKFIITLFPQMSNLLKNISYGSDFSSQWNMQKRLCTADHFPIYFKLGLTSDEVSKKEIETMLEQLKELNDFTAYLDMLLEQNKVIRFLTRLEDYTQSIESEKATFIMKGLLTYSGKFPEAQGGLFDFSTETRVTRILFQIYKSRSTQEESFQLVNDMIQHNPVQMGVLVSFFQLIGKLNGVYFKEEQDVIIKEHVSPTQFKILEKEMCRKIEGWITNPDYLKNTELPNVLFRWREFDPTSKDKITIFLEQEMAEDTGLIQILKCFETYSLQESAGSIGVTKKYRIHLESLEKLLGKNIDSYIDRIQHIHQHKNEYSYTENQLSTINLAVKSISQKVAESI
ncbi:KAP family P-loop NTPase fold protein [Bacillus thuringiensis]|uniref:KAP family P-loop NTPase fold protein n=2 Tax=Bacillus cereus group TaxID=86661 RepID=UPI000BFD6E2A|nr:KAP family NTPase [Bacillus thuringiensis]PGV01911.1 NTPase [Bacillus thuringiensis]